MWKYPLYHGGFRLWEVATSFRRADLALLLNRYDLEYAIKELDVEPEQTRTIANGILNDFLNLSVEAIPARDGPVHIAHIQRVS